MRWRTLGPGWGRSPSADHLTVGTQNCTALGVHFEEAVNMGTHIKLLQAVRARPQDLGSLQARMASRGNNIVFGPGCKTSARWVPAQASVKEQLTERSAGARPGGGAIASAEPQRLVQTIPTSDSNALAASGRWVEAWAPLNSAGK